MPRKVINTMPEDRKEQDTVYTQKDITYSDDTDAAWIKNPSFPLKIYTTHN